MSLFIGNLSSSTNVTELEKLFLDYGQCKINFKGTYAFAEFDSEKDAEEAFAHLKGKSLNGREMNIEWSKKSKRFEGSSRRRRSSSFKGRCYICGHHGHLARDCKRSRSRSHRRSTSYRRRHTSRRRRSSDYSRRRHRRHSSDDSSRRSRSSSDSSSSSYEKSRRRHRRRDSSSSRSRRSSYSKSKSKSDKRSSESKSSEKKKEGSESKKENGK